jgi:predicted RNase H-like HicB family nuclease
VSNNYDHYTVVIQWSEEDRAYIVTVPDLLGCITHGSTYEEAVSQGRDAIESWIDVSIASARTIPAPGSRLKHSKKFPRQ